MCFIKMASCALFNRTRRRVQSLRKIRGLARKTRRDSKNARSLKIFLALQKMPRKAPYLTWGYTSGLFAGV